MSCFMSSWVRSSLALVVAASVGVSAANAQIFDDFSDLDDTANPTWTHLNGLVGSTGQTWDASTGQYHLNGPTNGFALPNTGKLGFVGSYTGPSFSDVVVTADFVQPATGVAFGVMARTDGNNAFNQLKGYGYVYEPLAAGGLGEVVLYKMVGATLSDIGSQQVTLDLANKDYTFSLAVTGTQLHGQVFEVGGGMVAEKFAVDAAYASGFSGVFGYSGALAGVPVDFTIDNFGARVPEPGSVLLASLGLVATLAQRRRRNVA
ncbi:hypothetical protein I41_36440 [Lacipirellula limnantheis]|uniref:Ice-binding protein C-terminal domain-containing protein n=2 Tax=Lacipirellula limnantheis TaxID=2528024 RepID=A0A517U1D1_9BACT|nr:hypothetical protein I41_36440 [Lacipirellula limnantheis]